LMRSISSTVAYATAQAIAVRGTATI